MCIHKYILYHVYGHIIEHVLMTSGYFIQHTAIICGSIAIPGFS